MEKPKFDAELPPKLTDAQFFKALLASMSILEIHHVVTFDGAHQEKFLQLLEILEDMRDRQDPLVERMPDLLPHPATGKSDEFDRALLDLDHMGATRLSVPFFSSVEVRIPPEKAEQYLEVLYPNERQLFTEFAQIFAPQTV